MHDARTKPDEQAVRPARGPDALPWLLWAWLALLFASNLRANVRDPRLAPSGSASIDNLVELGIYALIAAGCLAALARHRHPPTRSAGVILLMVFGLAAVSSTIWSEVPLFTAVRGSQIIVLALLSIVSLEAWRSGRRDLVADWTRLWFRFGILVGALLLFGIVARVPLARFAWPGTHPIWVGTFLALGAVVALSMLVERGWQLPLRELRAVGVVLAVFLVFLFLNWSRTTLLAFAIGAMAVYLTRSARRFDLRALVLPFAALLAVVGVTVFSDVLMDYVLRGETLQRLSTFSQRTELWAAAWDYAADHLVLGSGYASERIIFLDQFHWGGHLHNSWLGLLIGLGLGGVGLGLALVGWPLAKAISVQRRAPGPIASSALGVLMVTAVASLADYGFGLPSVLLTVLALTITAVSAAPATAADPEETA